jgi:GNAT superfamily N-acetyltransferase
MRIAKGFPAAARPAIAALYWEAFGQKLGRALGPRDKALRFIEAVVSPDHAVCAWDDGGRLLGVAGFKTREGSLVGGDFADMARVYGWIGASWRLGLLALLSRDTDNVRFLMDGIFVAPWARGQGVGTGLLDAIAEEGNLRARALYERKGYRAVGRHSTGLLRYVFRFDAATTMVLRLP